MTITNKYLQEILPCIAALGGGEYKVTPMYGQIGYEVPCPFCGRYQDKERKRRKKVGTFIPCKSSSYFKYKCKRGASSECSGIMEFHEFLEKFDSGLFNKYQMERFHAGTTGKGHTLEHPKFNINKPKFDK